MYIIDKIFEFDYGHRVWSQKLNKEFALDESCVCRHLHGHRAKVHVFLKSIQLDPQGMVTDFKHLNFLKKFFDDVVDHKFLLDKSDPLFNKLTEGRKLIPVGCPKSPEIEIAYTLDLTGLKPGTPEYELFDGYLVVDFIPTSENLSAWVYKIAYLAMSSFNIKVDKVEWFETPKSRSTYIG